VGGVTPVFGAALGTVFPVAALCWAGPARAADLYLAGDLGISWFGGEGTGTNDIVGVSNRGSGDARELGRPDRQGQRSPAVRVAGARERVKISFGWR
jgi:hypothetical protein